MSPRTVINGRYELEALPVAKGGMGEVWFGHDIRLDRPVALKFVRFPEGTPDEQLTRRFVRESRIAARLEHPGVPAVYDAGVHDGRPYLVMQRINGISVSDLIAEQGQLPVGWAAAIAAQTCAVLSVAHGASLVHRDLKPGNLMLEPDGSVKVLDFGLAMAIDLTDFSKITNTGQVIGTPAYMAPEQILAGLSGPSSDLYALGCTLHEMLCGQPVFAGSTSYTLMNKQVAERPEAVRTLRPEVPVEIDELVLALLQKKPEDRPASADDVYARLLPFAADLRPLPGVLNPPSAPSPARMYAAVLSRVFATTSPSAPVPPVADRVTAPTGGDLAEVRAEADRLIGQSRYNQAADLLAGAVEQAGDAGDDTLRLRQEYADALFESGDYHRAAPAYRQLVDDLTTRHGPDAAPVLTCRLREATCQALLGHTTQALRQLQELLEDERAVFGDDDSRVLDLRRQIGLLQLGAGQRRAAEQTLTSLLEDLRRIHSPDHPAIAGTADLLAGLRRPSGR
ncbi:protein kinase [Dactylosporangium sucinum]|uniref:non-specific serine/threonine protein kinase n=1 Tax=Dactylosporangium sucinum TaxID=1424081 RepID=A0A917TLM8_9ACTN|nr:serine/threonine-protein kinase [Dactylosporangium sucinum]GGM27808.1 protein kinase [Dactylosporangium sucinum]